VVVDGQSIRLLADLADKPWAAEEGEPWQAAFPCTLEPAQLHEAELTVAPDVTIMLPVPQQPAIAASKSSSLRRADAARQPGLRRAQRGSRVSGDEVLNRPDRSRGKSRPSEIAGGGGVADALTQELAELRQANLRLRGQLDRLEADSAETARCLDALSGGLRDVTRERDDATAARDRIAAELEAVHRERREIVAERDVARRERAQMAGDREAAQRDRDRAVSERDAALSIRDHALAERDADAVTADEAAAARDELSRANERLQSELADLRSAHGAALVMRRAAQAHATSRRYASIVPRAITITVVIAIVVILLILLHVM
jgi:uncharacterized protein (DUF3084 family)